MIPLAASPNNEALTKVGQALSLRDFSGHFRQGTGASPSFVSRSNAAKTEAATNAVAADGVRF